MVSVAQLFKILNIVQWNRFSSCCLACVEQMNLLEINGPITH